MFRLELPACAAEAEFGCVGGADELYAAYRGAACTEMWYVKPIVGQADHLPPEALVCTPASRAISPLTGGAEGFTAPTCRPYWARNCMPGTSGQTSVRGTITHPAADAPFSVADATLDYRTIERGIEGETVYGVTQHAKVNGRGAFTVRIAACSPAARVLGCDGGDVEAWPAYNDKDCGPSLAAPLLVAAQPQTFGSGVCDTRGTLEVEIRSTHPAGWALVAINAKHKSFRTRASETGVFSLRLIPGQYRLQMLGPHKQSCRIAAPVRIGIASVVRKKIRCK